MNRLLAAALLVLPVAATAQEPATVPEPPRYPAGVEAVDEPTPEPEVTIVERERDTVFEYRINGRLYMIKVTPPHGKPYYLVDRKGNGSFVQEETAVGDKGISVPMWVIHTF